MATRSIVTALALSAAAMAVSGGGCSSSGGGGDDGGDGGQFFVQTWGDAAPNNTLATFFDEGENGDKISLTQHTGSMTVRVEDGVITDDPGPIAAAADGADENPMYLELDDGQEFPNVYLDSAGTFDNLDVLVLAEGTADERIDVLGLKTNEPRVGDDLLVLFATSPGQFEVDGGALDYMSMVSWMATEFPDVDDDTLVLEFGNGHLGLVTPVTDMPTEGEAHYDGVFEGIYVVPSAGEDGFFGDAVGVAGFTADFVAGTVEGGVHEITVVDSAAGGDIAFTNVVISDNTFSGGVVPGEGGFADFDAASAGAIDGTFYGPVDEVLNGPAEAGAALTLQDATSGAFVTGAIGANVGVE